MPSVLVVDDDPTISVIVAEALRDDGYAVDVAGNGARRSSEGPADAASRRRPGSNDAGYGRLDLFGPLPSRPTLHRGANRGAFGCPPLIDG